MRASSLTRAMLTSRWMFSTTLAASATRIDGARQVPAAIMPAYSASTASAAAGFEPEVILRMSARRRWRSPGLTRSGL
ncbi:hypothetical protein NB689_002602 [Xanthomonas sacchari]|nr:hypothetical protein [Xanthomonas sacchari]